jgi:hypothetical protein
MNLLAVDWNIADLNVMNDSEKVRSIKIADPEILARRVKYLPSFGSTISSLWIST